MIYALCMARVKTEMIGLRIQPLLKEQIREVAELEDRSITGQLLYWAKIGLAKYYAENPDFDPSVNNDSLE